MTQTSTPTAGARPDEVRRHNRTAVLRRLHVDGPCTRAALATELGLNRSTIKAVVDGLAESGVVSEHVPRARTGAGRPSLLVLPRPLAAVVLAVDIRVEQVAVALVGLGGEVLGRNSWILRAGDPADVLTDVVESARLLTEDLAAQVVGAGVSIPGVVRRRDGFVHEAPNLRWRDVPLGDRLTAVLGVPTLVANDAEIAARAEHLRGAARGTLDAVYVSADVGVGAGVISDGKILRGTAGYVGELGHMAINPAGLACYCGNRGCWETEVGELALGRALDLPEHTPRGVIMAALRALPEPRIDAVLGEFTEWLATGLVTIVNAFAPELVVLGDLFTALPTTVVTAVGRAVTERSLVSRAIGGTRVLTSTMGTDAKLIGAAELAFEPVLDTV